jgi:hypothetical protein
MSHVKKLAAVASVAGALVIASGASAAPPTAQALNPPPPDGYTCHAVGGGTICTGSFPEDIVSEPQFELVCGSGPDAFIIHDNGHLDRAATRWYDRDGNLTRRVFHDQWTQTYWSNPLSGRTVPYHQNDTITDELIVPGDFSSARETTVGNNIMVDPVTHKKVLQATGRTVIGADGNVEFRSGKQPFLDAFIDGDMSVLDDVCAALA